VPVGTASVIPLDPMDGPQNKALANAAIYSFFNRTQKTPCSTSFESQSVEAVWKYSIDSYIIIKEWLTETQDAIKP
jgi:hypothetical protein